MADADALREPGVTGFPSLRPPSRESARRQPGCRRDGDVARRSSRRAAHPHLPLASWRSPSGRSSASTSRPPSATASSCRCRPDTGPPGPRAPATRSSIQIQIAIVIGIILAMPVLLYQLWALRLARAHARGAQDRPAVDPAGARCSSRSGSAIAWSSSCRSRSQFLLSFTDDVFVADHRRRSVLRLRDDAVPGLRARDGVPDPAVGLSPVGIVTSERLRSLAPDRHPRHRDLRRRRDARRRPGQPVRARRHDVPPVRG